MITPSGTANAPDIRYSPFGTINTFLYVESTFLNSCENAVSKADVQSVAPLPRAPKSATQ
jgi:hypothetical protein